MVCTHQSIFMVHIVLRSRTLARKEAQRLNTLPVHIILLFYGDKHPLIEAFYVISGLFQGVKASSCNIQVRVA